ncbi:glycine cleavage system H protein [Kineococcus radiotolerans]|uniref:Glycine cleavage system H protein n=2 Tax=Kineococcus radiotolerans TaxID=131568 RepID=A6WCM2_KINRD|nr:glycine cleavage system protein GcvH [Kineococcus radiotolerans]ABS04561.1 glycine cleavage system H protein [Kineococcus radiotolerans SRS30216 = ATCC BAA-149]MBB2902765.1 glycine cleavage system H protein [Kineococcus radiotolerans]
MSNVPADLRYTSEHEWVRVEADGTVRVGITDHAQDALGDVVYVSLPAEGETVTAGGACGEVESTKSVSEITAPVSGTVSGHNPGLETRPDLVNTDPYGEGWMFTIAPSDTAEVEGLLDAEAYAAHAG